MPIQILLSLDALTHSPKKIQKAITSFKNFQQQLNSSTEINSACVLSPDQVNWPTHFEENWQNEFTKLGQAQIQKNLKPSLKVFKKMPHLILQPLHSLKASVLEVLKFAENNDFQIITVISHLKHQEKHLSFPGSFIESLFNLSRIPILVISALNPTQKKFKKLLFTTDFSIACDASFKKTLELAKMLNATVDVLHISNAVGSIQSKSLDLDLVSPAISGMWPQIDSYLQELQKQNELKAKEMIEFAKSHDVKCQVYFEKLDKKMPQKILAVSKKLAPDLLVVTNQSGALSSFFLGSVSKEILKKSSVPVLVFPIHSQKK